LKHILTAAALSAVMLTPAAAQAPDPKVAHADYANPALWLCRPGLKDDKCKVDLDATVIAPSGKTSVEKFVAAKDPKIDCFFVYPTVSMDPGWQSDFVPDKMEWDDVKLQFARFGKVCRTFAPMYRQGTLTGLRVASGGAPPAGPRPPAGFGGYADVVDAWNWYLKNENKGRGVVLIGHSQGAGLVARLAAEEIDGKPIQKQLVSAIVLGASIMVPPGKDVGGTLKSIPLCRAEDQVGCAITYVSFRDTLPPPKESRFGRARDGLVAGCTSPSSLKGGKGVSDSYFLTKGFLNGSGGNVQPDWARPAPKITTPFVHTPGLVSTECRSNGEFSWLAVHVNANPADARTDELGGEIIRPTGADLTWGLHLIDVDHSMGDLIRIVGKQAAAYGKR
jgi:pimeloyl-ACP methyl ester carboxylesterase